MHGIRRRGLRQGELGGEVSEIGLAMGSTPDEDLGVTHPHLRNRDSALQDWLT
jgi:hypothetical protein